MNTLLVTILIVLLVLVGLIFFGTGIISYSLTEELFLHGSFKERGKKK